MSRRPTKPTGLPGGDEEDSDPSALLLLCPLHRKKYMWLLQAYHTPETPVFASSNPMGDVLGNRS